MQRKYTDHKGELQHMLQHNEGLRRETEAQLQVFYATSWCIVYMYVCVLYVHIPTGKACVCILYVHSIMCVQYNSAITPAPLRAQMHVRKGDELGDVIRHGQEQIDARERYFSELRSSYEQQLAQFAQQAQALCVYVWVGCSASLSLSVFLSLSFSLSRIRTNARAREHTHTRTHSLTRKYRWTESRANGRNRRGGWQNLPLRN